MFQCYIYSGIDIPSDTHYYHAFCGAYSRDRVAAVQILGGCNPRQLRMLSKMHNGLSGGLSNTCYKMGPPIFCNYLNIYIYIYIYLYWKTMIHLADAIVKEMHVLFTK